MFYAVNAFPQRYQLWQSQRLFDVFLYVFDVLEADGETDVVRGNSRSSCSAGVSCWCVVDAG